MWWFLIAALAADAPPDLGPQAAPVSVVVWGAGGFLLEVNTLDALVDGEGRPCAVDAEGISCFDGEGAEAWGVELAGVQDVIEGRSSWLVLTQGGATQLGLDGQVIGSEQDVRLASLSHDGKAAWVSDDAVGWFGDEGHALPPGVDPVEVLAAADGRMGVIDDDGVLHWVDASGAALSQVDLELAPDGPVRAVPLSDGWAVLDDDGVQIIDARGRLVHDLDVVAYDVAHVDGGLWLATDEGVLDVDIDDGSVELEDPVLLSSLSATRDGDVLLGVGRDSARLLVLDEDDPVAVGHTAAVVALAPRVDGGLASVDARGQVIVWTPEGVGTEVPVRAVDVAWDDQGGLWLATGSGVVRWTAKSTQELPIAADYVASDHHRVVVGDGRTLRSLDPHSGDQQWSIAQPHQGRVTLSGETLLVPAADGSWRVLEADSARPRRRLAPVGVLLDALGISVDGLVTFGGPDDDAALYGAWRPGVAPTWQEGDLVGRPAPNARWAAWHDGAHIHVVSVAGDRLHRGAVESSTIASLTTSDDHVWVGRDDGRIERWHVQSVVDSLRPPRFNGYAQLDPVVHAQSSATHDAPLRSDGVLLLADDGSAALMAGSTLTLYDPDDLSPTMVLLAEPQPELSASTWLGDQGFAVGSTDGRLWRISPDGHAHELASVPGPVGGLCVSGNTLMVGSAAGLYRVGLRRGQATRVGEQTDEVGAVACHDTYVAAQIGGRVHVLSPKAGRQLAVLEQGAPIRAVSLSPTAEVLATGGDDEVVVLWQPDTWTPALVLEGHGGAVHSLSWGMEGTRLLAATDARSVLWEALSGQPLLDVSGVDARVALHPDGTRALLGAATPTWLPMPIPEVASPVLQVTPHSGNPVP